MIICERRDPVVDLVVGILFNGSLKLSNFLCE